MAVSGFDGHGGLSFVVHIYCTKHVGGIHPIAEPWPAIDAVPANGRGGRINGE
jgi:hypothetical protein